MNETPTPTSDALAARERAVADSASRAQLLADLRENAARLAEVEQTAEGLRLRRNDLILRGARMAPPLSAGQMGGAAAVSHSYVSRVIRDQGRPVSGSPPPAEAAAARARMSPRRIGGRR